MLFFNNVSEVLLIIFFYMFVYNVSLLILFWVLFQFVSSRNATISSLTDLKSNQFFLFLATTTLLSIAGVPPFMGFFSKLFILVNLLNSHFSFFFAFFFILLFFALYFYLQNIRFLYSTTETRVNFWFSRAIRSSALFFVVSLFVAISLLFGFLFLDEFLLFFCWLLS